MWGNPYGFGYTPSKMQVLGSRSWGLQLSAFLREGLAPYRVPIRNFPEGCLFRGGGYH